MENTSDDPPAWLLEENDSKLREEIMPLFGTGQLPDTPTETTPTAACAGGSSAVSQLPNDLVDQSAAPSFFSSLATRSITAPPSSSSTKSNSAIKTTGPAVDGYGSFPFKDEEAANTYDEHNKIDNDETTSIASSTHDKNKKTFLLSNKPHRPHRPICLHVFYILQSLGVISSISLLMTQCLPYIFKSSTVATITTAQGIEQQGEKKQLYYIVSLIVKGYISLFLLLFIFVETNLILKIPFLKHTNFLQNFITKGFLYSFIGFVCVIEGYRELGDTYGANNDNESKYSVSWMPIFMEISSWLMVTTGAIYMFIGIFCCKQLRDKLVNTEREEWIEYQKVLKEYKRLQKEKG